MLKKMKGAAQIDDVQKGTLIEQSVGGWQC